MQVETFTFEGADGLAVHTYHWRPDEGTAVKGVVQIAHGMAEHAGRYAPIADVLTARGYAVYANDHRGHGLTAATPDDLGHLADEDGWVKAVADLHALNRRIAGREGDAPIILLGHSMGSFMTQRYVCDYGDTITGAALSASAKSNPALVRAGGLIARFERLRLGRRGRSGLINAISFGAFNKPYKPARTDFDWLSRDESEVDKYVADPLCGFVCTTQTWVDFLAGLGANTRRENLANIRRDLPLYLFSGSEDPVSNRTKDLKPLTEQYRALGVKDVTERIYPGGRHEIMNETNRAEVLDDLTAWLDTVTSPRKST